jgi:hypothetical protein
MSADRDPSWAIQIGLILAVAVILNVAFYFLSSLYYEDRAAIYGPIAALEIEHVRSSFAWFTGALSAASILVVMVPLWAGLGLAGAASLVALAGGILATSRGMTPVLPASLLVSGAVLVPLIWRTWAGSRAAWAFLIGMISVLAVVMLFGATKLRTELGVRLYSALIIPGLLTVATVALARVRGDYREA